MGPRGRAPEAHPHARLRRPDLRFPHHGRTRQRPVERRVRRQISSRPRRAQGQMPSHVRHRRARRRSDHPCRRLEDRPYLTEPRAAPQRGKFPSLRSSARGSNVSILRRPSCSTRRPLDHFTAAIERIVAGLEKKSRDLGPAERSRVAHHEMGHALVAATLPGFGRATDILRSRRADLDEGTRLPLEVAARNLDAVGLAPSEDEPCVLVADKGYHARDQLKALDGGVWKTRIAEPEPAKGYLRWHGDEAAKRAVYANRARLKSGVGREPMRRRGELVERSFAHVLDRGGMRRAWLRGRENIHKRYLIHVAGFNLGVLMRALHGQGTPREAAEAAYVFIFVLRTDAA